MTISSVRRAVRSASGSAAQTIISAHLPGWMEPVSPAIPASAALPSVALCSANAGVTPQYFTK